MRPAQLGGTGRGTATPGSPFAFGTVNRAYQDDQTRQWFLEIKLEGGKLIRGVMALSHGDGAASGSRGRLPANGTLGVVAWPSFPRTTGRAVWVGSLDGYFFGMDTGHRDVSVTMHPSGAASAVDERGATTTRYPGGDLLYVGPEEEGAYDFRVRTPEYVNSREILGLDDLDDGKEKPLEMILSGVRLIRRVALHLFGKRGELTVDTRSGRASLRAEVHTPDDKPTDWKRGQFTSVAGEEVRADVDNQAGERAGMSASLKGGAEARLTAKGEGEHSELILDGDDARVDAEMTRIGRPEAALAHLASAPPVDANFQSLAREVAQLKGRMTRAEVKLNMLPGLWAPLSPIAGVPLVPVPAPRMQAVKSPNVQAERGGDGA